MSDETPRVGVLAASPSELGIMRQSGLILEKFGVGHEIRIMSASRNPDLVDEYARTAFERGLKVDDLFDRHVGAPGRRRGGTHGAAGDRSADLGSAADGRQRGVGHHRSDADRRAGGHGRRRRGRERRGPGRPDRRRGRRRGAVRPCGGSRTTWRRASSCDRSLRRAGDVGPVVRRGAVRALARDRAGGGRGLGRARARPAGRRRGLQDERLVHGRRRAGARAGDPARRRGLRRRRGGLGRRAGALDPLRHDLQRRPRHRVRPAAASSGRSVAGWSGGAPRRGEAAVARASSNADDGALARDPCRADVVRPQTRGRGLPARSRSRSPSPSPRDRERRAPSAGSWGPTRSSIPGWRSSCVPASGSARPKPAPR